MKIIYRYLLLCGVIAHIALFILIILQPIIIEKVISKVTNKYYTWQKKSDYQVLVGGIDRGIEEEISLAFLPWNPSPSKLNMVGSIQVNDTSYDYLPTAVAALKDGDVLLLSEGVYRTPIVITKNNITIKGNGHVVFEKKAAHAKGFILSQGDDLLVNNIECRGINVRDGNGACIRQEGKNLTVEHVYFHNSQEGILETSKVPGYIKVYDSRFERLGYQGQAHGIYTNKAKLYIYRSLFLAAKSEGHAIKVRGDTLHIEYSVLSSLSSVDSRLVDMPNGGELVAKDSILAQGPNSSNGQVIGFGLEGIVHKRNSVKLIGNIIYLERIGVNKLLALPKKHLNDINVIQAQNIVIGGVENHVGTNSYFQNRKSLGLPEYPFFSISFCQTGFPCFFAEK